nr:MAG TPA: hypothetical protein [Bacteriophage sp.]
MQPLCIATLGRSNHKLKVRESPYLFFFRGTANANQTVPHQNLKLSPWRTFLIYHVWKLD